MNYIDALEFILAGSRGIQIGTANFVEPKTAINIINGLTDYLNNKNIKNIMELTGKVRV